MRDFLDAGRAPGGRGDRRQELFTSVPRSRSRSPGSLVAYAIWGPSGHGARAYARATEPLPRLFENKFGFDLVYDLLIARARRGLATLGARVWEGRVVASSMDGAGPSGAGSPAGCSLAQSGLVRSYAICSRSASVRSRSGS